MSEETKETVVEESAIEEPAVEEQQEEVTEEVEDVKIEELNEENLDDRIKLLAREYNGLSNEYARVVMRRIKNVYITDEGELTTLVPSDEIEAREEEMKEEINEILFELDQALGVKHGLERK